MRKTSGWSAFALAVVVLSAGARAADVKEKAEVCKACHGDNSISQMENIPSLAGQLDQYIQWQLVYFRSGSRKNEQMQPIVEGLTNEDIRNLGAYFAALPPFKARQGRQSGSVRQGQTGRDGPALRLMSRRQFCRHQGGPSPRRPARGLSRQDAARLQIKRAERWSPGRDVRRRLSAQRRGDHRARALSLAFVTSSGTS